MTGIAQILSAFALWAVLTFLYYKYRPSWLNINEYAVVLIALMASFGLVGLTVPSEKQETGTNRGQMGSHVVKKSEVRQLQPSGIVWQVSAYIEDHLRDPDSYESVYWGKLEKTGDGNWGVIHKYRAKNGFGGYDIESRYFVIDKSGNVIEAAKLSR